LIYKILKHLNLFGKDFGADDETEQSVRGSPEIFVDLIIKVDNWDIILKRKCLEVR
jgi:hypothetical protein